MTGAPSKRRSKDLAHRAAFALDEKWPHLSAQRGITKGQWSVAATLALFLVWAAIFSPASVLLALTGYVFAVFAAIAFLRSIILWRIGVVASPPRQSLSTLTDETLPVYTILVPLLREAAVVPDLVASLSRLDYPPRKIDIKLILEEDDRTTIAAVRALDLDDRFEVLIVPPLGPQTKPKACNFALGLARGELVVIYDAEDRPEPDQLRRAANAFAHLAEKVICLQARLNYHNADENWLTRQFTIEYAIWFYAILPGLAELGLPFTLGGTSNHFRTGALRRIGAWDAYNVTEDADVGMRLARFGFRSAVLESTTWEEANCRLGNWIRQRSRWQKGFLQTWLVHMREPRALLRALGWRGFCVFQILVGGSIVTGWAPALFLASLALSLAGVRLAPASAVYDALIVGNLLVTAASIFVAAAFASVALRATGQRHLLSSLPGMPLYWLLVSIGAAKGGWQFLVNRSYWEKTTHGLSHAGAPEGAQASLSEDSVWLPCASQAARSGQP